jgi:hypothetical protein
MSARRSNFEIDWTRLAGRRDPQAIEAGVEGRVERRAAVEWKQLN